MSGPKRIGPAAGDAAAGAGIDAGERALVTTPRHSPPTDLEEARFQRLVARLHGLGPRALAEFLAKLGASRMVRTEIETMLRRYLARLDAVVLREVGGDRLVPIPPPRLVKGRR